MTRSVEPIMGRTYGAAVLLMALLFLFSAVSVAMGEGGGGSERAVVKPDSLAVHAKSAKTGKVRKSLKQGEVVFIDTEITDSDGVAWCGIREEGDEWVTGFVLCEGLVRSEPAKSEKWRPLPYREEPPPPRKQPRVSPQPPKAPEPPVEPPKGPEPPAVSPPPPSGIMLPRGY